MKKIIFLISIFFLTFTFCVDAQDKTMGYDDTYLWYDGTASDTIGISDSIWTYEVRKKTDSRMYCYVDMYLDSTGGTANSVKIYLQNKFFPDQDYTNVDSVTWAASADTAFTFYPSSQSVAFTQTGGDTMTSSVLLLTDTTGLDGYPADSIAGTITNVYNSKTFALTVTEGNQNNMGEYWRIYMLGSASTLKAKVIRLNFKFLK